MDKALAIAESSALGLLTLITGASPPEVIRELLLPPLDSDMAPSPTPKSDPSTTRSIPRPIRTQLSDPTLILDDYPTRPSVGPGAYDSSVIPPSHPNRTLVLCFDGTGDCFDADNSNIVQFFSMLKKDDKSQQMVYYQVRGGWIYAHVVQLFKLSVLGRHRDVHDPRDCDAILVEGAEEHRHGSRQSP
jgi:hypothetical protein